MRAAKDGPDVNIRSSLRNDSTDNKMQAIKNYSQKGNPPVYTGGFPSFVIGFLNLLIFPVILPVSSCSHSTPMSLTVTIGCLIILIKVSNGYITALNRGTGKRIS